MSPRHKGGHIVMYRGTVGRQWKLRSASSGERSGPPQHPALAHTSESRVDGMRRPSPPRKQSSTQQPKIENGRTLVRDIHETANVAHVYAIRLETGRTARFHPAELAVVTPHWKLHGEWPAFPHGVPICLGNRFSIIRMKRGFITVTQFLPERAAGESQPCLVDE